MQYLNYETHENQVFNLYEGSFDVEIQIAVYRSPERSETSGGHANSACKEQSATKAEYEKDPVAKKYSSKTRASDRRNPNSPYSNCLDEVAFF